MSEARKVALVTGGSGGIGSAICRRLAADGRHVVVHAKRNGAAAEAGAADIRAAGGSAQSLCFDVTDADAARAALEALIEAQPVQILVNNAGIHADAPFPGMSAEQWQGVIAVTVDGFYNVTHPLLLPMIRTRWGRIVNITSISALIGNRGQVNYAAAKGAVHAATKALSLEVASRGITVNCVAPGIITTPMSEDFGAERISTLVPMKRAGTPQEVAGLVAYLSGDDAAYVTGQIIAVAGGLA